MSMSESSAKAVADSLFSASLAETDPEIADAIGKELGRQRDEIELIASENIVSRAVLEAQGSVLTNKYAEGLAGQALLRRLPVRRHRRDAGDRAREEAVRRRLRQCAAAFRRVRQRRGVLRADAAGRHLPRPEPRRRRPSHPRLAGQRVRQMVQGGALRRAPRRPPHRHGRGRAGSPQEHKPKLIVAGGSAYPRIIDFRAFREIADSVGAKLMVDMAHFAGLVAGGVHPSPFPHAHVVTTTTHKTLRGPRGGMILTNDEELGKKINSAVFPGLQGGPLMHVIAAKAVAFGEALRPSFKLYAKNVVGERQGAGRDAEVQGLRYRLRRHRHASDAGRPAAEEADRQGRRRGARPRPHHLQQERHPVRSGEADGHLRHPARHAGRHHARLRRRRVPAHRRTDRRGARCAVGQGRGGRRGGRGGGAREGQGAAGAGSRSIRAEGDRGQACAVRAADRSTPR